MNMKMNLLKLGLATSVASAWLLACGDDASSTGAERSETASSAVEQSSAVPESSSSAIPESSSGISSSISDAASSSSSFGTPPTYRSRSVSWKGSVGEYRVKTSFDSDTEASGIWYSFDDSKDGGRSAITWPVEIGNEDFSYALDPVIDECGGICGTFKLDAGTMEYKPFVGVAFNVAGLKNLDSNPAVGAEVADASSWGGICITYTVDVDARLELSMGEPRDSARVGFDLPYVTLLKSEIANEVCVPWARFKQDGWGTGKITGDEIAANLASVRFKIQAQDGSAGQFNISAVTNLLSY